MSLNAYVKGSEFPPLQKDTLRLYNMRFCPYTQRTLLVLAHKNIQYEIINVNLKQKPEWLLERNPQGLVPVLEYNNEVVYESTICNEYLEDKYPTTPVIPKDPYTKARLKILMEKCSKFLDTMVKLIRSKTEEEKAEYVDKMHQLLKVYEDYLGSNKFFGGNEPCILDYHIWPFIERFPAFFKIIRTFEDDLILSKERFPKLSKWVDNMYTTAAVKATAKDADSHAHYLKKALNGEVPDYDYGLTQG